MQKNLFIPTKIRVGFQKRDDTFTGMLAYLIYFDEKGQLRKESSFNSWRDNNIPYIEFENKPTNGFIFNKGIKRDGHFGSGRSVIRVHHPDDFEFEISVDNLIGILMNTDVSKRDIQGECVFAWAGKDLVLLPTNSLEYEAALNFTAKQDLNFCTKDLKIGHTYAQKKSDTLIKYLGYFDYNNSYINIRNFKKIKYTKKHIFYDSNMNFITPTIKTISGCVSDVIDQEYSNAYECFEKSNHSRQIYNICFKDFEIEIERNYIEIHKENDDKSILTLLIYYFYIEELKENKKIFNLNQITSNIKYPSEEGYDTAHHSRETSILTKNLIFNIFPEILKDSITTLEFIELARLRGFKQIYIEKVKK